MDDKKPCPTDVPLDVQDQGGRRQAISNEAMSNDEFLAQLRAPGPRDELLRRRAEEKEVAFEYLRELLEDHPAVQTIRVVFDASEDCWGEHDIHDSSYFSKEGKVEIADEELNDAIREYLKSLLPEGWREDRSYGTVEINAATGSAHVVYTYQVITEHSKEYNL